MKTGHKVALGGAVIVAVGTIIAPQLISDDGDKKEPNTSASMGGDMGGNGDGPRCQGAKVNCPQGSQPIPENTYRTDKAPSEVGPWAYKVVRTVTQAGDEGLMVRTCNVSDCPGPDSARQVGLVRVHHTVWVECWKDSGYDGGEGQGITKWYKVKWPTDQPHSTPDLESSREDKYTAWMYSGYMEPSGHNGKIPECSS
ncbi:hypothetical protein [Streptomyces sp. KAU_LT]|uniref:hypothetical protein n=1 Tax=Streptomyces sp. KAU_LT TaxID=3046669 RepID=UPI0024B703F9|nr:hypothetical protein [Streptomyces sp. KAU_LT]MDI9835857.1 hypothetical protein [Streptomyces sp. KAU_LT]